MGAFVNENEIIENVNKTVSLSNLKDLTDSVDEYEATFNFRGVFFGVETSERILKLRENKFLIF